MIGQFPFPSELANFLRIVVAINYFNILSDSKRRESAENSCRVAGKKQNSRIPRVSNFMHPSSPHEKRSDQA